MKSLPPYQITVNNRVTGAAIAEFWSNQVPTRGDLINTNPTLLGPNDPFAQWCTWIVDVVVWVVAQPVSMTAGQLAREVDGDPAAAYCNWVDVHVWPAEGPHWAETPKFVALLSPDDDEGDSDDE